MGDEVDSVESSPAERAATDGDETVEALLASTELFARVAPADLRALASLMEKRVFHRNEMMLAQGQCADRFFFLMDGDIKRTRVMEDGTEKNVKFDMQARTINSMHIVAGDKVFASVSCVSDECHVYEMMRGPLLALLEQRPQIQAQMIGSVCRELRRGSRKFATPLLEQHGKEINVPAVTVAATMESYYRSALNSLLNARLTGVQAELFPNMHVQVPVRVMYINGFKGLRTLFDRHVDANAYEYPTMVRLATAVAPGIIMTPISSILEASNAGHSNPEAMTTRWMRGVLPRGLREIIFGVGLNQLSEFFEERILPVVEGNTVLANAGGSLCAGVVSGYLSHVPHNLSTYKLMSPHKGYRELYRFFVDKSVPAAVDNVVADWHPTARTVARSFFATVFPRGVVIRTAQIVGSFAILNGIINIIQTQEYRKRDLSLGGLLHQLTDLLTLKPIPGMSLNTLEIQLVPLYRIEGARIMTKEDVKRIQKHHLQTIGLSQPCPRIDG
ncbi:hypothetical protein FVE85_1282 [Porphyridium purpureum]|uniref:Cyclic nucleotide-binding domain-containing protein n=1 Tax=Porphyridium purpureum TaxID=35688 RepID=A0A5J4YI42_PORPP|nr:hypothetical protein FVE85_1282 [Porphyridium purpureum]|eukprot:POR8730..scf251_18